MTKLDLVKKVWAASAEIRDWYATQVEQPTTIDDFTTSNVRAYGLDGMGEIADQIIESGIEAGILTQEEADQA